MRFSIAICTYNPEPDLLNRVIVSCVDAAELVEGTEILVIDNNSRPPVRLPETGRQAVKLIHESRQGLAFARIAAVQNSVAPVIVFADDDNVLEKHYLVELSLLLKRHPEVAVWGPGFVEAEFGDGGPAWIKKHFSSLYQEKKLEKTEFGRAHGWPSYFPSGSGMAVSRTVLESYAKALQKGDLSASGRKGASLASAEDAQIVWTAVKAGFSAGTSPSLRLTHVIRRNKQSLGYLVRLQYNIARSYYTALAEIFPEQTKSIRPLSKAGYLKVAFQLLNKTGLRPVLFIRWCKIEFAWFRGVKAYTRRS